MNLSVPADGDPKRFQPKPLTPTLDRSPALSMANTVKDTIKTRKVAILAADGVDDAALSRMKNALMAAGAQPRVVAPRLGMLKGAAGADLPIDFSFLTAGSVLFDAVYIPGGDVSVETLKGDAKALVFVKEAYLHCKPIAATDTGIDLLLASHPVQDKTAKTHAEGLQTDERVLLGVDEGIIAVRGARDGEVAGKFIQAIARHRHWERETKGQMPA
jgi:catalase